MNTWDSNLNTCDSSTKSSTSNRGRASSTSSSSSTASTAVYTHHGGGKHDNDGNDDDDAVMSHDRHVANHKRNGVNKSIHGPSRKAATLLAKVGVSDMIRSGVIAPGQILVIYMGKKLKGKLLANGNFIGRGKEFTTPSGFALHMMHSMNPTVRTTNGYSSIWYKGERLEVIRNRLRAEIGLIKSKTKGKKGGRGSKGGKGGPSGAVGGGKGKKKTTKKRARSNSSTSSFSNGGDDRARPSIHGGKVGEDMMEIDHETEALLDEDNASPEKKKRRKRKAPTTSPPAASFKCQNCGGKFQN